MRKTLTKTLFCIALLLTFFLGDALGDVRLPRLFSDGMVLQRGQSVPVWGWANAGEQVSVKLLLKGKVLGTVYSATADAQGRWCVMLSAMKAMGPLSLQVGSTDGQSLIVSDVWVGDVWLCSGQSNIDTNIERVYPQYAAEIDADTTARVRLFQVANEAVLEEARLDVRSDGWKNLSRKTAWRFSALGYFLGKRMARETGVVQGIIQSSWGGTPIESWIPRDSVARFVPRMAEEARYYCDAELRRLSVEANAHAAKRWNQMLDEKDPGVQSGWMSPEFDDAGWQRASQYRLPVRLPFNGSYWMRQHIRVDKAHAGQSALLLLGTLVDADYTYLNGQLVGHTGYQYPPRRYRIPQGLLREGDNVLTVRFVNRGIAPKFVPEKPYCIRWDDGTQFPLAAEWAVSDGTQMPLQPSLPASFQNMAAAAYHGMLAPLAPYGLAGVVWYQGESNTDKAEVYESELRCLMADWRTRFSQPELPFVVVQLANFMAPSEKPQESQWARLRESQRRAVLADPHAALAVAIDLGEANDIHPLRKKELAERVALSFDNLVFGRHRLLAPSPVRARQTADGRVLVTFDQKIRATQGFELAGEDGRFHNVIADVQGNDAVLQGSGTRVRYAWKDNPVEANCRSVDGSLPATPFEMDIIK